MAVSKNKATTSYAWVVLIAVFLASVAAPLNQNKVPPVMPELMEYFHLDLSMAGWLMSVFALTGFILAIPAGFILQRFGAKLTGLLAVMCLILGSVLGALSTTAVLMLASRVVEGIGTGLIAVVAPAVIAMWFPAEKRGTPMGLWATWVHMGTLVIYNLAPIFTTKIGWQAVWWFGAVFSLFTFVLYWKFVRSPSATESGGADVNTEVENRGTLGKAMANRSIWLLSLSFACYNLASSGLQTFLPTFLVEQRDYTLASAAFVTSLTSLVCLFSCPLGGIVSDRLGTRKWIFVIPALISSAMWLFPFKITGWLTPAFMIFLGILFGAAPTAIFAAVPEVMKRPQLAGIGMAVVSVGQYLGMFAGPLIFGRVADSAGWAAAGYTLIPTTLLGALAGWFVKVR